MAPRGRGLTHARPRSGGGRLTPGGRARSPTTSNRVSRPRADRQEVDLAVAGPGPPRTDEDDPGPEGGYQTWPPGAALLRAAETDQDKLLLREDVLTW